MQTYSLTHSEDEDREFIKKKENDLLELQKLQQKLDQLSQASSSSFREMPLEVPTHQSRHSTTVVGMLFFQRKHISLSTFVGAWDRLY